MLYKLVELKLDFQPSIGCYAILSNYVLVSDNDYARNLAFPLTIVCVTAQLSKIHNVPNTFIRDVSIED